MPYSNKKIKLSSNNKKHIKHILCWAHSRSKFYKAWEVSKSAYAEKALDYIRTLFELEDLRKQFSGQGFFKQRKLQAGLVFKEFKPWLEKLFSSTPPKSNFIHPG